MVGFFGGRKLPTETVKSKRERERKKGEAQKSGQFRRVEEGRRGQVLDL